MKSRIDLTIGTGAAAHRGANLYSAFHSTTVFLVAAKKRVDTKVVVLWYSCKAVLEICSSSM